MFRTIILCFSFFLIAGDKTVDITGIKFENNLLSIIHTGNVKFKITRKESNKINLIIENARLLTEKEYKFDSGLITEIAAGESNSNVVVDILTSKSDLDYSVFEGDKILSIKFNDTYQQSSQKVKVIPPKNTSNFSKTKSNDIFSKLPKYKVDIEYSDTDLKTVIIQMMQRAGINVIFDSDVAGNISISLKNVPFNEAFKTVLNMKGLVAKEVGEDIIRISTPKKIMDELKNTVLQTRIFFLNYVKASDLKTQIESIAQAEGRTTSKCNVDETNNALIITDTPYGLDMVEKIIKDLDRMPKQVLIEAKLVEVSMDSGLYTGVKWGVDRRSPTTQIGIGNSDNALTDKEGNKLFALPYYGENAGTGVNLSPEQFYGSFRFMKLTSRTTLDVIISAAVKKGKANVLSNPKIATLNNKEASINITNQIPYVTTEITNTSGGSVSSTKVTYVTAGIVLTVLPTITSDGKIMMKISPKVSKPSQAAQFQPPSIDERTADTTVVVEDGETIVIGGLIHDSEGEYIYKVPFFGDIPVIGYLFKKKTKEKNRMELLIFVTPKII